MSFDVDRSSWAHIALCADLTWAAEPPDEFIVANQRLWAQHCCVQQMLRESASGSQDLQADNKRSASSQNQEKGNSSGRRSVKDVIPQSRLAKFYGNLYYDEHREKCYSNPNERVNFRGYNGQESENSNLTECWMLPEVDYWFRRLLDNASDQIMFPRRRRQHRMLPNDDFERWGPSGARGEEATLAARVSSVRGLWASTARRSPPRAPSPPPASRKIRARRRQPRRLMALPSPPPAYCLEMPAQLFCDPTCKFQFDAPRPPQLAEYQRAMGRLTATVTAAIRASSARCPPYRGTNVSRYAPTGQRPARYQDKRYIWWTKDHPSPRLDHRFQLMQNVTKPKPTEQTKTEENIATETEEMNSQEASEKEEESQPSTSPQTSETPKSPKEILLEDGQLPSTSAAEIESGLRKKRLYSTVLSTSAQTQINLTPVGCIRLTQKLAPGIIKLNPKIVLPKIRPNVDNKFEELEKEALEQYKASDESIDTKFKELEMQAEEQYSNSNSNTSCSYHSTSTDKKQPENFHKEKPVDSVVIYSQNFPDLLTKQTSSDMNLKNFHGPPRGGKRGKSRSLKSEMQRAASDTDYEAKEAAVKTHKGPMRWSLHVVPPKKRHLTVFVADFSSDDETGSIKDQSPRTKAGKMKISAHGGGDLHPIMRKT